MSICRPDYYHLLKALLLCGWRCEQGAALGPIVGVAATVTYLVKHTKRMMASNKDPRIAYTQVQPACSSTVSYPLEKIFADQ